MKAQTAMHKYLNFYESEIDDSTLLPSAGEDDISPMTLRLPVKVKKYYDLMGDSCGLTTHGAICQVLSGNMEQHLGNKAKEAHRKRSNRFFDIFTVHGIEIHDIPKFLKDFNVTGDDLVDDSKVSNIMLNNKLVGFLAETFNLHESWIKSGETHPYGPYRELHCYKVLFQWLSLMQHHKLPIELKLFFSENIPLDPKCNNEASRGVKPFLIVEDKLNKIAFKKLYMLEELNWDYEKTNNHIYGLIEAMNITLSCGKRNTEYLFGQHEEMYRNPTFGFEVLENFQNSRTSFKRNNNSSVIKQAIEETRKKEIDFFQKYGKGRDSQSIQWELEDLKNEQFKKCHDFM